jgi:hypothetical protein
MKVKSRPVFASFYKCGRSPQFLAQLFRLPYYTRCITMTDIEQMKPQNNTLEYMDSKEDVEVVHVSEDAQTRIRRKVRDLIVFRLCEMLTDIV